MNDQPHKVYREDNLVYTSGIRRDAPLSDHLYLGIRNPNETTGVTVYVNFYVWRRTQHFHYVDDVEINVSPKYVTLYKQRMAVNTRRIRVCVSQN
ncbi:MAG: hypothetical protein JXR19_06655 [Bacteroidia bacterium]